MIYYIADTHFGHANILKHDHRPFENTEEMDTTLINNWNERVKTNDDVYIIGDLCFRNADHPEEWYLKRLNGRKHLIIGNHDKALLRNEKAMSYFYSVDTIKKIIDGAWPGNGTWVVEKSYVERHYIFHRDAIRNE